MRVLIGGHERGVGAASIRCDFSVNYCRLLNKPPPAAGQLRQSFSRCRCRVVAPAIVIAATTTTMAGGTTTATTSTTDGTQPLQANIAQGSVAGMRRRRRRLRGEVRTYMTISRKSIQDALSKNAGVSAISGVYVPGTWYLQHCQFSDVFACLGTRHTSSR